MKSLVMYLSITVVLTAGVVSAGTYSGGDGSAGNPYQIANKADLLELGATPEDYGKCFILTSDIDLAGEMFTTAVIAPDTTSSSSGFQGTQFMGVFDGHGYRISNLTITGSGSDYVGLFGYIGTSGQVRKLGIVNLAIQGRGYVGGLAGFNANTIYSCYVTGTVNGSGNFIGGMAGVKWGSASRIEDCYCNVNVSGNWSGGDIGGLVGNDSSGWIVRSYSMGTITSPSGDRLGGLAGSSSGNIDQCWSSCSLSCSNDGGSDQCGGLAGRFSMGLIRNSFSCGEVIYGNYIGYGCGGLVGTFESGTIINCYSTSPVRGIYDVGGFIGKQSGGDVANSFSTGLVNGPYACRRGFIGYKSGGSVTRCFWDKYTSNLYLGIGGDTTADVTGKTTAEMRMISTFTSVGWDFVGEAANGTVDYWRMCEEGVGYPRLSWESGRRGDFACPDGIGVEDLEALGMVWLTAEGQAGYRVACDANSDGRIDMADFEVLAGEWMGD